MNVVSRTIIGIVMIVGGIVLIVVAAFNSFKERGLVALIYGIPILIIGIVILLNKKEDAIERIKHKTVKGGKKK